MNLMSQIAIRSTIIMVLAMVISQCTRIDHTSNRTNSQNADSMSSSEPPQGLFNLQDCSFDNDRKIVCSPAVCTSQSKLQLIEQPQCAPKTCDQKLWGQVGYDVSACNKVPVGPGSSCSAILAKKECLKAQCNNSCDQECIVHYNQNYGWWCTLDPGMNKPPPGVGRFPGNHSIPASYYVQEGYYSCPGCTNPYLQFPCSTLASSPNKDAANAAGCIPLYNEPDADSDGVVDAIDNCPNIVNKLQEDSDGDHIGDACDCKKNLPGALALTSDQQCADEPIVSPQPSPINNSKPSAEPSSAPAPSELQSPSPGTNTTTSTQPSSVPAPSESQSPSPGTNTTTSTDLQPAQ